MSLGVLNNLSAVYAENNLNNTNNSLNTVLQQLSSGSKINSGADDAAGLSLVDGLQANQTALMQSETNATEGVGLLQVADGALSQVTSLLNRAVTLATEASNGTLDSTQDTAANQEYQSILSEINNIGTTTTYNQQQVFGSTATDIYTGDSSLAGSSIDSLNIRSLSSANVGDTGGVMSYSNGQSSVFLNLSSATQNAQSTDTLNSSGSSTIDVNYLVKGADGTSTAAQTSISVGGTSGYSNTAGGLISAINGAGLGLSATFTTAAEAGVSGGGTQTGIQISGGLISVGVDPSTSSTSGTLNPSEITSGDLTVGQTITVNTGSTVAASITINQTNDTLTGLANAINTAAENNNGAGGVTATVVTNSDGTATSLQLADNSSTGGALTVTTTPANLAPNELTPGMTVTGTTSGVTFGITGEGQAGVQGTATLAIAGAGSNSANQVIAGNITLTNGTTSVTFATGTTGGPAGAVYLGSVGNDQNTLGNLATAIGLSGLGATAVAGSSGLTITSTATGTNIAAPTINLTGQLGAAVTSNVAGLAATQGSDGSTIISMTGDAMGITGDGTHTALTSGTHITLTNGTGDAYTFTMAAAGSGDLVGQAASTDGLTAAALVSAINNSTATTGMQASITGGNLVVSSTNVDTSIVASGNTLSGTQAMTATSASVAPPTNVYSTVNILTGTNNPADDSLTTTGDTLTGSITIGDGTNTATFDMGGTAGYVSGTTYDTGADTLASLESAINNAEAGGTIGGKSWGAGDGMTIAATADDVAGGTGGTGLTLTESTYGPTIAVSGTGVVDTSTVGTDTQTSIGNVLTDTLSADDGGQIGPVGTASVFSGSFAIKESQTGQNGGASQTLTVVVGAAGKTSANDTAATMYVQGNAGVNAGTATMTQIEQAIGSFIGSLTNTGGDKFDVTASVDANTGGLTVQAGAVQTTDTALSIDTSSLVATQTLTPGTYTQGSAAGEAVDTVTNASPTSTLNINDVLTQGGTLTITNSAGTNTGGTHQVVFTVGAAAGTETGDGSATVLVGEGGGYAGNTLGALVNAINAQTNMNLTASVNDSGQLVIASKDSGDTGTIGVTSTLTQAYGIGNVAGTNSGIVVNAGSGPTQATSAAASINTAAGMSTAGTDVLGGQIILTNSTNNTAVTFNLGQASASDSDNVVDLATGASTVNDLVEAINGQFSTLGLTASVNSSTGALQLQAQATDSAITVGGTGLKDNSTSEVLNAGTQAQATEESTGTLTLASGTFTGSNALTGSFTVTGTDGTITNYVMYGTTNPTLTGTNTVNLSQANSTVTGLIAALHSNGINAAIGTGSVEDGGNGANSNQLLLTSQNTDHANIGVSNLNLSDSLGSAAGTASLGTFTGESDQVSGTLEYSVGGTNYNIGQELNGNNDSQMTGLTARQLINVINYGNVGGTGTEGANGVTASWVQSSTDTTDGTNGSNGFGSIVLTANTYGATDGNIANYSSGTSLSDGATSATISYTQSGAYSVGISNVAGSGVYDSSISTESKPSGTSAPYQGLTSSAGGSSGIATISYSDGAGQSLSATDLSSQADAETALTNLNAAIADVAAQDGYVGAQINTLNAVSSVLSTQQENVESAQNAVQATDYASATSDMSKYEILSQTGIAALAQANSSQQEVLKLLQ